MSAKPAAKKPAAKSAPKTEDTKATRFTINDESFEIDASNLTWGEMADVEEYFGADLDSLGNSRSVIAVVGLGMKRKKPETTFDDVKAMSIQDIVFEEERPTSTPDAAGSPS